MKLESVTADGDGTRVVATGSEFVLGKDGKVRCFQRIPQRREVARLSLPFPGDNRGWLGGRVFGLAVKGEGEAYKSGNNRTPAICQAITCRKSRNGN